MLKRRPGWAGTAAAGVSGSHLAFYNWGHVRQANFAWIADTMKMLQKH
jgi:hypothetical protein